MSVVCGINFTGPEAFSTWVYPEISVPNSCNQSLSGEKEGFFLPFFLSQ